MANVLFALLGSPRVLNGAYERATYDFDGNPIESNVFSVALLKHLEATNNQIDKVVVFGTANSAWGALGELADASGNDVTVLCCTLWELQGKATLTTDELGVQHQCLMDLSKALGRHLECAVVCARISDLATDSAQRAFYEAIEGHLADGDQVWVDVTHALGHQRILLAQTVGLLATLRPIKVRGLFVGAHELKKEKDGLSPVVKLHVYIANSNLMRAVQAMEATGDPRALALELSTTDPLRAALLQLSGALRLNQAANIRAKARAALALVDAADASRHAVRLRRKLGELLETLEGSDAEQMFRQARAMLRRGDLLRASLALREGCFAVAHHAGHIHDKDKSEWLRSCLGEHWADVTGIRNALAHGSPPVVHVSLLFRTGDAAVQERLSELVRVVHQALRAERPGAF